MTNAGNGFILYTKADCPLCAHAERLIMQYLDKSDIELVDIIGNEDLETQYIFRIPVLMCGRTVVAEGLITEKDLDSIRHISG